MKYGENTRQLLKSSAVITRGAYDEYLYTARKIFQMHAFAIL